MSTDIPEVSEDRATGELAAAYERIRQVQGLPMVGFIWRHLATFEGGMPWAWNTVEAALPRIDAALEPLLRATDAAIVRHGLADGVRLALRPEQAADVVRTYERNNSWNSLAMTVLTAVRAGAAAPSGDPTPAPLELAAEGIPPLPRFDVLAPELRAQIDRLSAGVPAFASGLRPSLWVHLALWPALLRDVADACTPVLASPAFREAHRALLDEAMNLLGLAPAAPVARPGPLDETVDAFRQRILGQLLIGRVMMLAAGH